MAVTVQGLVAAIGWRRVGSKTVFEGGNQVRYTTWRNLWGQEQVTSEVLNQATIVSAARFDYLAVGFDEQASILPDPQAAKESHEGFMRRWYELGYTDADLSANWEKQS